MMIHTEREEAGKRRKEYKKEADKVFLRFLFIIMQYSTSRSVSSVNRFQFFTLVVG